MAFLVLTLPQMTVDVPLILMLLPEPVTVTDSPSTVLWLPMTWLAFSWPGITW